MIVPGRFKPTSTIGRSVSHFDSLLVSEVVDFQADRLHTSGILV